MKSEWEVKPITNIVGFNPKHTVKKGALVSYVEMAAVPEHSREIAYFDNREFKSGSKFQNGDTLFSRIPRASKMVKLVEFPNWQKMK